MNILGILLMLVAALMLWNIQLIQQSAVYWISHVIIFSVLVAGVYLSRLTPYLFMFGIFLLIISSLRYLDPAKSQFLLIYGIYLAVAAIIVFFVGQFDDPWKVDRNEEDRTDREVKPRPKLTDAQKLDLDWSTEDKYADWPVAGLMLDLCKIAYEPPVNAREKLQQRGYESETIESGSMSGYVIKSGENAVILFRGTEGTWHDIIQDLIFVSSKSGNGDMHRGFRNGYDKRMHQQVEKLLQKYDSKRVWITGHSLGGALAVVCAHDLIVDGKYKIAGVMTFGQPKVIRENMRKFLEPKLADKYVFFVNNSDPVAKAVEPYDHFGHMVWYHDGKIERSKRQLLLTTGTSETGTSEQPEINIMPPLESFSEKELNEYIKELQEMQKPNQLPDGQLVPKASMPNVNDHYLDSYRVMIDVLTGNEKK